MKTLLLLSLSLLLCTAAAPTAHAGFSVKSKEIKAGAKIAEDQVFNSFGCSGKNISPEISWSGAPKDTKFFGVTMYDPDAPTGSGWWHWFVLNIPANVTKLEAGAGSEGGKLPEGALQTRTDFGKPGYGGPCPPPGDRPHRYIITVFALKEKIELEADAPGAMAGFYLRANKLAEAKITATYGR